MKALKWILCCLPLLSSLVKAEQGLERIVVEKYYISDRNDSIASGGQLHVGSVTYRIFVDMKPGYRFQAAYGIPGHPLEIATTTSFYNQEELGSTLANGIYKKNLGKNTVMLDSWLSVAAGSDGNYGVLKNADTTTAVLNSSNALQNDNAEAGIPIKIKDGLVSSSPMVEVVLYGIDSTELNVFKKNIQLNGQKFRTENGSWAAIAGSVGNDTSNTVLIAQLTTSGELSFKLNVQIGTPYGGVENYVAENPTGSEILFGQMTYPNRVKNSASVRKNN